MSGNRFPAGREAFLTPGQRLATVRGRLRCLAWILARRPWDRGYCPICEKKTVFVRGGDWLRDQYLCTRCLSIPRFRALIHVLGQHFPDWRRMAIHESSPSGASSRKLASECPDYVGTQFSAEAAPGRATRRWRCENLEALTFEDGSHDLVVTQDVFEHVLRPEKAFAEIGRTLKPGGAHVFTVPIHRRWQTLIRAVPGPHGIEHLEEPDYHGNPLDGKDSLVTREWGRDVVDFIRRHSGLETTIHWHRDRRLGLDGEFLEVCISRKAA